MWMIMAVNKKLQRTASHSLCVAVYVDSSVIEFIVKGYNGDCDKLMDMLPRWCQPLNAAASAAAMMSSRVGSFASVWISEKSISKCAVSEAVALSC